MTHTPTECLFASGESFHIETMTILPPTMRIVHIELEIRPWDRCKRAVVRAKASVVWRKEVIQEVFVFLDRREGVVVGADGYAVVAENGVGEAVIGEAVVEVVNG